MSRETAAHTASRVLVACEFSGVVRDAFATLGHDATSCDLLPSETPGQHIQADVRDLADLRQHVREEQLMDGLYEAGWER